MSGGAHAEGARLAILARLSKRLAETVVDPPELFRTIARELAEVTGAACTVRLLTDDGLRLRGVAAHHAGDPELASAIEEMVHASEARADIGIWQPVVEERRPVRVEVDLANAPPGATPAQLDFMRRWPMRWIVGVPLVARGVVLGGISLVGYGESTPDDLDEPLLVDLAERAALALDNARLLDAERAARAAAADARAAVERANADLERRVAEACADLERASAAKTAFLARLSHEIRTPLAAVIGFSELLDGGHVGSLTETQQECVGDVLTSARHVLDLVDELLDVARIESGHLVLHTEAVDLAALVDDAWTSVRPLAAAASVTLSRDVEPGSLVADRARLRQVVVNLLSNAVKVSPRGAAVVVRGRFQGETVRVEVEDRGPGLAPEHAARLFQDFVRIEGATSAGHGTGLGLAISRRIVEAHGGRVGVESELGRGSVFFAELPRDHGV